jgi:beta-galactosidase
MAIIGSGFNLGKIKMQVSSVGFESETIEFEAIKAKGEIIDGISAFMENKEMPCVMGSMEEIPVRKVEIISYSGQVFNEAKRELSVSAIVHPKDASYKELEWSVVNDVGIISNIAKIEALGNEAKVIALGDGEFRVRCTSKNGTDKTKIISELEFKAIGLGVAYKDPYGFISAGLYDYSKGEVGNGNGRGVATSRDGETQVGFRDIDFGEYGSDVITIPIFALTSDEYSMQIWEGIPDEEGSTLLADVIYQKETIWNVYQEETYHFRKRLKGITSICFVLSAKVHIKGFYFERKNKALEKNMAIECNHIYGDTFEIKEKTVEGIGNNVSLEFENMDFGGKGAAKLVIYGRSPIDKNTINIQFSNEDGQSKQIIEFAKSKDAYEKKSFELERITGKQKVTFIFLPGCKFDFEWFRFER